MAYCICPTSMEFYAKSGDRGIDDIKHNLADKNGAWGRIQCPDLAYLPHILVFSVLLFPTANKSWTFDSKSITHRLLSTPSKKKIQPLIKSMNVNRLASASKGDSLVKGEAFFEKTLKKNN